MIREIQVHITANIKVSWLAAKLEREESEIIDLWDQGELEEILQEEEWLEDLPEVDDYTIRVGSGLL